MATEPTPVKRRRGGNGGNSIAPGLPPAALTPDGPKPPSRSDLQRAIAYVDPSRLLAGWITQPYNPGWLASRKGLAVIDTMRRDEQVKAALQFKKDTVLAAGWEVVSPGGEEEDWEVTRFVQDALDGFPGGWHAVLLNVLGALDYGYSVEERVYAEQERGEWKGKLVLARAQALKPHYIDFVTDEFGQLLSLRQQSVTLAQRDLPPAKFLLYSYAKQFGNFYGTSDLEACYRAWWVKDNAYKWLAVTLERFGMPPLFAMYDPNAYQAGQVEELKKVVKGIQNATLGVLPRAGKDALELWSQQLGRESSSIFLAALERFDQHIARALLVPSMMGVSADEGKTGSLARSETHAASFLRVVAQLQADVAASVMNAQVIPQLCDLNYANLDAYPLFRFLPFSDERRLEVVQTWAALVGGKVVGRIEDDEAHLRKVLGFPENEDIALAPLPEEGAAAAGEGAAAAGPKKVPEGEQTAEMRAFAEAAGGEWYAAEGGSAVCYAGGWDESAEAVREHHYPGKHDQERHGNRGVVKEEELLAFVRKRGEVTSASVLRKFGSEADKVLNDLIAKGRLRGGLGGLSGRGKNLRAMWWRVVE